MINIFNRLYTTDDTLQPAMKQAALKQHHSKAGQP